MSPLTHADDQIPPGANASGVANLLRWLGTGAVALSALVFLMQGLDDMTSLVRTWSYLALMALLTVSGVGTRTLFGDAKSARLLLGLAVALLPIQFAQLGGMVHSLVTGEVVAWSELFGLHAANPEVTGIVAAASLAAFVPVAYAGFSVLARAAVRPLCALYLLANVLLVLPWRDSVAGFAVLAALVALVLAAERRMAAGQPWSRTAEGRAVRAMLALPAAIAGTRLGFHVEAVTGYCALAGLASVTMVYVACHYVRAAVMRELLFMAGAGTASVTALVWIGELPASILAEWRAAITLGAAALVFMAVGSLSEVGRVYRLFASVLVVLAVWSLTFLGGLTSSLTVLLLGVTLLVYGCLRQEREPTLTGVVVAAAGLVMLGMEAWARISVDGWVALALVGQALVVCASLVERYGRVALERSRAGWTEIMDWR